MRSLPAASLALLAATILLTTQAAVAAPTFPAAPTDCAAFPQSCAGQALASPNSTRGVGDHPVPYTGAQPPEVQLFRHTMDLTQYPEAVCNDGSPAVFYFAPAPAGSVNRDKWVFQLEGGGGCLAATDGASLHEDCMDRWTGKGPAYLDFPRKMSTDIDRDGVVDASFLPVVGRVPGLLGADTIVTDPTQNGGLDAWNRVFVNYCSSDLWIGQSGPLSLAGGEWIDPNGNAQPYPPLARAWFHGHRILESVMDAIAAGVLSDEGEHYICRHAAPETIVLAGDSAGGGGVSQNLDWLAELPGWGATPNGVDRGITLGVAGSTLQPPFAHDDATVAWYTGPVTVQEWDMSINALVDVDLDGNGNPDTDAREADVPLRRPVYESLIDAFIDQSCLAANTDPTAADPNQRHWLCYRSAWLFPSGEIATPMLVKQDLTDSVVGGLVPAFDEGTRAQMLDLPAHHPYFGPQCGHHETLSHGRNFKRDRVLDGLGRDVSYHTAIAEFIAGTYGSIFYEPGVTFRRCP